MARRELNERLSSLLSEAGMSRKGFARAVQAEARARGDEVSVDHTAVLRWVGGTRPRPRTTGHIASVLSARLGRRVTAEDIGWISPACHPVDLGLTYGANAEEALTQTEGLLAADLTENTALRSAPAHGAAWAEASLGWLVRRDEESLPRRQGGRRVGVGDVAALRHTTRLFSGMDDQFGGDHARRAVAEFLRSDVRPLLRGVYTDATGRDLFSAAAEAVHLLAWMSYDAGVHGMAQRYFIQSLRLAQGAQDDLLAASTLDAMSHQANYLGRHREAVSLARAAATGARGSATPTLSAHFLTMEARALATAGDTRGVEHALAQAASALDRSKQAEDPEWIRYFDQTEMANEVAHCYRDLGRGDLAIPAAEIGLSGSPRSNFFVMIVQADSLLLTGAAEEACSVASNALDLGSNIKSDRCVEYVRQFQVRLLRTPCRAGADLAERGGSSRMWMAAGSRHK